MEIALISEGVHVWAWYIFISLLTGKSPFCSVLIVWKPYDTAGGVMLRFHRSRSPGLIRVRVHVGYLPPPK